MQQHLENNRLLPEGKYLNDYLRNRMFRKNQNILTATTGSTGSGKSYYNLSALENYYRVQFKRDYPIENCCFSIVELMKRLNSGELKKGEVLILEEAGVNLGSLDFQAKVQKLFTYVLQSFRSLNIGVFFNLPALSLLNKSARILIHMHFITESINQNEKTINIKPLVRQMNQQSGKIYDKHPRPIIKGKMRKIQTISYGLPSERLRKLYENKKFKFQSDFNQDFLLKMEASEKKNVLKMARDSLTEKQKEIFKLSMDGLLQPEIAKKLGTTQSNICQTLQAIKKKGYNIEKSLEKGGNNPTLVISTPGAT